MMNPFYIIEFNKILKERKRGYTGHFKENNVKRKVKGVPHSCYYVDIKDDQGRIIQVFVLMRSIFRVRNRRYPIWELYHQKVIPNCPEVNPAVFIVTREDSGEWKVYSASESTVEIDFDYIVNYRRACDSFQKRVEATKKYGNKVKWVSWTFASLLTIYLIAHVVTNTMNGCGLPLTNQIVLLSTLIVFIILLPFTLPYTNRFSINGLVLFLRRILKL